MRNKTFLSNSLIIALILLIPGISLGDELTELKTEIQKLQKRANALEEELKRQSEITEHLLERTKISGSTGEDLPVLGHEHDAATQGTAGVPKLKLTGFADLGFTAKISDTQDTNTFNLGSIDLFITSEISPKMSFLAEPVFYFETDTNEQEFELQRAELKYSLSDLFNLKVGRIHTPLGYWNQAFHHGGWLQTTVFRPEVYLFEDDGGVLPVHSIGIEFFGGKEFDDFDLEYNFDVTNGRGRTREEIQHVKDQNDSKAINVLLSLAPHFVEGLKLGVNLYLDTIPSDPTNTARIKEIDERIVGGYMAYLDDRVELIGEAFSIYHDDETSGQDFDTLGFYLQVGYRINKFKPYYRFDLLEFEGGDPFFAPEDIGLHKYTVGLRWDIVTWNALKIEYSMSDKKHEEDEHLLTVNTSFAY